MVVVGGGWRERIEIQIRKYNTDYNSPIDAEPVDQRIVPLNSDRIHGGEAHDDVLGLSGNCEHRQRQLLIHSSFADLPVWTEDYTYK